METNIVVNSSPEIEEAYRKEHAICYKITKISFFEKPSEYLCNDRETAKELAMEFKDRQYKVNITKVQ